MTDISTEAVRENTDLDSLGPIDYIVVEFPAAASNFTGEMARELVALVDSGTIRVVDMLILTKDEDGTVEAVELVGHRRARTARGSRGSNWQSSWRRRTSCTSPPPWTREALPGYSSGRTCGLRPSHRRCGIPAAN